MIKMENKEAWLINSIKEKFRNKSIEKKKKEIELLKLELEKVKLEKEIERVRK
jgi:hypothetical protein